MSTAAQEPSRQSDSTDAAGVSLTPLDSTLLSELLAVDAKDGPFVSIYMPTFRRGSETRKNPIRFKTLLQQAEQEAGFELTDLHHLLVDEEAEESDNTFWQHQLDGLAIFWERGQSRIVRTPQTLVEKAAVADSYHVKPLLRLLQRAGRYQLLAVTQKSVRLFEGDPDSLEEVPLSPKVPTSVVEALGGELTGQLNVNSYGGLAHNGMFHGHHSKADDRDTDLDRYLRAVDRAVYEHHGRRSDLPLYFAGDVDYHDRFFKASHHPRLVKKGLRLNPDAQEVTRERMRDEMADLIKPEFEAESKELVEQFGTAKAQQKGSDDAGQIAEAAFAGRVMTLLLDTATSLGGRLDPETGKLKKASESEADVDDVLDDIAERVLKTGGQVRVLRPEMHPTQTGIAAIYRY